MAEALISSDHFYVNASYYNDTESDQAATIVVEDNDDILRRDTGDEWLVHVTRFSCDSMSSLNYIEADPTATWQIAIQDGSGDARKVFNFTLDRAYATPRDMLSDMNMFTRFLAINNESIECYRFEIDTGGRFRLTQPQKPQYAHEFWHIAYKGSASMNRLLGFDQITPFLSYAPDPTNVFCQALEFFEEQCNKANTHTNVIAGEYWKNVNNALIHLINGLEVRAQFMQGIGTGPGTEPTSLSQLNMNSGNWNLSLNNLDYMPVNKGNTPNERSNHANQALLPRTETNVMSAYFTVPGGYDNRDIGPKVCNSRLTWQEPYRSSNGSLTNGLARFNDIGNLAHAYPPGMWPKAVPGSQNWTNASFVYPLDSIPGYWYSGSASFGLGGGDSVAILSHVGNQNSNRTFELENALPPFIKVGDDVWSEDLTQTGGLNFPGVSQTHAIESISADRTTVAVDWPFGVTTRADPTYAHMDLVFTDRRIPYQTRSQTFVGVTQWSLHGPEQENTVITTEDGTNASIGDTFYFVSETHDTFFQAPSTAAVAYEIIGAHVDSHAIIIRGHLGAELSVYAPADTLNNDMAGQEFFIDKSKWDKVRFAQDTVRMKQAATTFTYEQLTQTPNGYVAPHTVNGISLKGVYRQNYDRTRLLQQVDRMHKYMLRSRLFQDADTTGSEQTQRITDSMLATIPQQYEEAVDMTGLDFMTMEQRPMDMNGNADVLDAHGMGTLPASVITRFPSVWWGVQTYDTTGQNTEFMAERARINTFVEANVNDKPYIHLHVGTGHTVAEAASFFIIPSATVGGLATAHLCPIVTGVGPRVQRANADHGSNFVFAMVGVNASLSTYLAAHQATAKNARYGLKYDILTRAYVLCGKEHDELSVAADSRCRLYGADGDYLASTLSSQVDTIFPYRQLILTSDDLMQVPERSQDAASKQPILTSYTLPTLGSTSVGKDGQAAGGNSKPFGTIYFSEGGSRRFHHMIKVPGGLRRFKIQAALTYKDNRRAPRDISLQPGQQFTCQLMFMKKEPKPEPAPAAPAAPDPRTAPGYRTMA